MYTTVSAAVNAHVQIANAILAKEQPDKYDTVFLGEKHLNEYATEVGWNYPVVSWLVTQCLMDLGKNDNMPEWMQEWQLTDERHTMRGSKASPMEIEWEIKKYYNGMYDKLRANIDFLRKHRGQWIAVYEDGSIKSATTLDDLKQMVPSDCPIGKISEELRSMGSATTVSFVSSEMYGCCSITCRSDEY